MQAKRTARAWMVSGVIALALLGLVAGPLGGAPSAHRTANLGAVATSPTLLPANSVAPPGVAGLSVLSTVGISLNETVSGNVSYLTVNDPNSVLFDPDNGFLYASGDTPFVGVLSASTYAVVQVLPSGAGTPVGGLVYSAASNDVYAANPGTSTVTVVGNSNAVVANVTVGADPVALVYSPSSNDVYVADAGANEVSVLDSSNSVVATISVGTDPVALGYDPADGDVYVANHGSADVSILSSGNAVVATVGVGNQPTAVGYSPASSDIYVANAASDNVTILSGITNLTPVSTLGDPTALAYSPATGDMYVADSAAASVTVITSSNSLVGQLTVGADPDALAYNPVDQYVVVGNGGSANASLLTPYNSVAGSVRLGFGPVNLAYDPTTGNMTGVGPGFPGVVAIYARLGSLFGVEAGSEPGDSITAGGAFSPITQETYFTSYADGSVWAYEANENYGPVITVQAGATAIVYSPWTQDLYVTDSNTNNVSVIGPHDTVIKTIPVGADPDMLAYSPDTHDLYVTNGGSDNVTVIGPSNTLVAQVPVGLDPSNVGYSPQSHDMYVVNEEGTNVTVIGPANSVVANVTVGSIPFAFVYSPSTKEVYVANFGSNNVSVILPDNQINGGGIDVGTSPVSMTYSAATFDIYVAQEGGNVTPISDGDGALPSLPAGDIPFAIAYDPGLEDVIVTNYLGANATVYGPSNTVVANLPTYSEPNFILVSPANGVISISDFDSYEISNFGFSTGGGYFYTGPDEAVYSPATQDVYVVDDYDDGFTVIAPNGQIVASFAFDSYLAGVAYSPVTQEVYLLENDPAQVTVFGPHNTIVATVPVSSDPTSIVFGGAAGDIYVGGYSGNVSIIGSGNTVVNTLVITGRPYMLIYDPASDEVLVANDLGGNVTAIGATNTIAANIPVPLFDSYSNANPFCYDSSTGDVWIADGYGEADSIIGPSNTVIASPSTGVTLSLQVAYDPITQDVYSLNNLASNRSLDNLTIINSAGHQVANLAPASLGWVGYWPVAQAMAFEAFPYTSVTLVGSSNTILGSLPLGSDPVVGVYSNATGDQFVPNRGSGTVAIVGVAYPVTVEEQGLPSGTAWSATVDGVTTSSNTASFQTWFGNGSYAFSAGAVPGYLPTPPSGQVTVNGAAATAEITYTRAAPATYPVTFTETGLASGATWGGSLNNSPFSGALASIAVGSVPNGTYSFTITGPSGFTANRTSGTVHVDGAGVTVQIGFSSSGSSSGSTGGVPVWLWAVIALVLVVVAVVALLA
ncbi:MAG: hypothetical protein WB809_09100, partial [Thermoplasmata archaeon]